MRAWLVIAWLGVVACGNQVAGKPPPFAIGIRCTLRVSQHGFAVDGNEVSLVDALDYCKGRAGAVLVFEDDRLRSVWRDTIAQELGKAGVPVYERGVMNDAECQKNPLARGCS